MWNAKFLCNPLNSHYIDGSIDCAGGKNKNLAMCKCKEVDSWWKMPCMAEIFIHKWNILRMHCRRVIKFQLSFINRTMCKWIRAIYCSMPVWHIDWSHAFSFQLVVNSSNMESPFGFIATRSAESIFINQKKKKIK